MSTYNIHQKKKAALISKLKAKQGNQIKLKYFRRSDRGG